MVRAEASASGDAKASARGADSADASADSKSDGKSDATTNGDAKASAKTKASAEAMWRAILYKKIDHLVDAKNLWELNRFRDRLKISPVTTDDCVTLAQLTRQEIDGLIVKGDIHIPIPKCSQHGKRLQNGTCESCKQELTKTTSGFKRSPMCTEHNIFITNAVRKITSSRSR